MLADNGPLWHRRPSEDLPDAEESDNVVDTKEVKVLFHPLKPAAEPNGNTERIPVSGGGSGFTGII